MICQFVSLNVIFLEFWRCSGMKKCNKAGLIIGIVTIAAAVATAVTAILLFLDRKKKDEEELERYLDCSIQ